MNRVSPDAFEYYDRLARVRRHLEEHLSEAFPVETAARIACLSPNYFSAFFRTKTGIGFREWVNATRIERARQMIAERNHPLRDVAFKVGFRDVRTFERAFKRHMDTTPLAFKKSVRPRAAHRGKIRGRKA